MRTAPLGEAAFGTYPFGGPRIFSAPTVNVTAVGDITTGGPDYTIVWTYNQTEGKAQSRYRVRWEVASGAVYDSGWVAGTDVSKQVDLDAADFLATETSGTVTVYAESSANNGGYPGPAGSETETARPVWGDPQITITSPAAEELVPTTDLNVAWTYEDPGKTQTKIRVQLYRKGDLSLLHDSGWIDSAATDYDIPVTLIAGTTYQANVQVKNNHGMRSR